LRAVLSKSALTQAEEHAPNQADLRARDLHQPADQETIDRLNAVIAEITEQPELQVPR
jgi:hypothetical protein